MLHFDNVRVSPCNPGFSYPFVLSRKRKEKKKKKKKKCSQIQSLGVRRGREMRASLIIYNRHRHNYHYNDPFFHFANIRVSPCNPGFSYLSFFKKKFFLKKISQIQSLGVRSGREVSASLVIYSRHRHNYHYNAPFCQRLSQSLKHKFQLSFFLSFKVNKIQIKSLGEGIFNHIQQVHHYNAPF